MAYFTLKAREVKGPKLYGIGGPAKPRDQRVKVNLELREGYIKNVRTTCVMRRGDTESNIRVGGALHQAIVEFEKIRKCRHLEIRENSMQFSFYNTITSHF